MALKFLPGRVEIVGYAKEGLFNQHTTEKAIKELEKALMPDEPRDEKKTTVSINRSPSEGNTEPRATMVMPKNIMPKHAAINDFLIDLSSIIFTYLLIRF